MRRRRHSGPSVLGCVVAFGVLFAGCSDFEPADYLQNLRVLALTSDPIEAVGGEELVLDAIVYVPEGETVVAESWSFCPLSAGSRGGFACLVPDCELPLAPDPADGKVRVSPGLLAAACFAGGGFAASALPGAIPGGVELPDQTEVVFRYTAETDTGFTREAVLRVTLFVRGAPEIRNRPPRIRSVEIDGRPPEPAIPLPPIREGEGLSLSVAIDPDSLDAYIDEAGRERVEEPILSFYATAGRFASRRLAGSEVEVDWKAKELGDDQTEARLYVVVRDLRGGQVVAGPYVVPIDRKDAAAR